MSGSPPAIEAERLGRDYGNLRALDALDLMLAPGQVLGLLGPNGAGKTTAMLVLATLLAPTRGRARVFGCDVLRERRAVRRRLGLVFQETTLDGLLTVSENLLFAARLAGLDSSAAKKAVAEGLEWSGLGPYAGMQARALSGGWRRITDLARALLHQPDLLILDEPTVGLDPEHRDRVWSLLEMRRREHGTAILFSTHYLPEADSADRVVLLAGGTVVASDAPSALTASIGSEVAEIDGPGAERLVGMLSEKGVTKTRIQTERGYRVGLTDHRNVVIQTAAAGDGIIRFALRPATLEDVYFAKTQKQTAG